MRKIHIKRAINIRHALCGIAPEKDCFTTDDLLDRHEVENICKVCLKVLKIGSQIPSGQRSSQEAW